MTESNAESHEMTDEEVERETAELIARRKAYFDLEESRKEEALELLRKIADAVTRLERLSELDALADKVAMRIGDSLNQSYANLPNTQGNAEQRVSILDLDKVPIGSFDLPPFYEPD